MATQNNPARTTRKINISRDGEYTEEFISRRAIQTHEFVILEPIFTSKDYFRALFLPDKYDLILIAVSVLTLRILSNFIGVGMYQWNSLIFIGIFGIFYYTTRFAYFSVTDLYARIQKLQNPHRLVNELDFDFNFWGLIFNFALIGIGSYFM